MMRFLICFALVGIMASCQRNNVNNKKEYKALFEKYKLEGTFASYNNIFDQFNIYNFERFKDSSYSPASTFKIVNSLIGLEVGAIQKNEPKKWDGVQRSVADWNKDLKFKEAFQASAVWYFQDVARTIGKDTMQRFLDSLNYGSKKITTAIDSFWLNNSLTITPDEQLGLLRKLYFKQLSKFFSNRTMDEVIDAMEREKTDKYVLAYKTGLTTGKNGKPLAWVIGWVQSVSSKSKVTFFVLNAEGGNSMDAMIEARMNLLKDLLKEEKLID